MVNSGEKKKTIQLTSIEGSKMVFIVLNDILLTLIHMSMLIHLLSQILVVMENPHAIKVTIAKYQKG